LLRPFLDFFLEFFSFLILVGCVMDIVRRFFLRSDQLRTEEDITSLIFIYIPHGKLLHIFTSSVTVVADRQKELTK
jgi:hypothetical protein